VLLRCLLIVGCCITGAFAAAAHPNDQEFSCHASRVHYEDDGTGRVEGLPWVALHASTRARAYLSYYGGSLLADSRINSSSAATTYARHGGNVRADAVVWRIPNVTSGAFVSARQLDGSATHRDSVRRIRRGVYASPLNTPAVGCWRVTIDTGKGRASMVVRTLPPPPPASSETCGATPIHDEPNSRLASPRWVAAAPDDSMFAVGALAEDDPAQGGASIYTHGVGPDGRTTKVLWVPAIPDRVTTEMRLVGKRLDASGRFKQSFKIADSRSTPPLGPTFPSIPDVPSAGCWAFILQSGQVGALVVVRATDAS
jgi:hypothetical protein